jgi:hypothetical protein
LFALGIHIQNVRYRASRVGQKLRCRNPPEWRVNAQWASFKLQCR